MQGTSRTVTYLQVAFLVLNSAINLASRQNLGPQYIELILEFSLWVLLQSPEEGLAIFTEDMDTVEALPRGQVN